MKTKVVHSEFCSQWEVIDEDTRVVATAPYIIYRESVAGELKRKTAFDRAEFISGCFNCYDKVREFIFGK